LSPRQLQIGLTNAIGRQGSCLNVGNVSARKLAFICITVKSYLHMHVCTWPGRTLQQIAATKALKRDDRCRESWQKLGGRWKSGKVWAQGKYPSKFECNRGGGVEG